MPIPATGIQTLSTDWGVDPRIIRITTTDNLAAITTTGYLTTQQPNIAAIQNTYDGLFQWLPTDYCLIAYNGGEGFFTVDYTTNFTFIAAPSSPGFLSDALNMADIFVGNGANVATGVPVTGAITISDTGLTALTPNIVNSGNIAEPVIQYAEVSITLAHFLANYTTPVEILIPVAGNIILIKDWAFEWIYGAAALATGGAISLQYAATAHGAGIQASNAIAAADLYVTATSTEYSAGGLMAISPNTSVADIGIYLSNPTADFTVGTGGSGKLFVWYAVIPVP